MKRTAVSVLVLVALTLFEANTAAAQAAVLGDWLGAQVNERGQRCERHAEQRDEARVLLACGPAGVWAVVVSESGPRFVQSFEFPGDVVGFFTEADGRLWVKLQVLEARPFSAATPSGSAGALRFPDEAAKAKDPPAADAAEPVPRPPPAKPAETDADGKKVGRVVRSSPGEVVISLGTVDGIARSDRIELALEHLDDPDVTDAALSREAIAIGVVTHVTEHNAKVRLGVNESVPVGAVASSTKAQSTSSLTAPPRVAGIWSLELMARPFAALDELGAGGLLSASLGRRFAGPFHLRAVLDPFGYGDVKDKSSVTTVNATVLASYDSQYFEIGLGFGGQTVNDTGFFLSPGSGLAVAQLIRLGAQDGLHVTARTSVVLFHSQFGFGGMVGNMQIPVSRGYWLLLGGGGGDVGYGFGEFGLRAMLRGNGHAGSRYLTVTAGGAAIFRNGACDEFSFCESSAAYGGPMAGIGYEARF